MVPPIKCKKLTVWTPQDLDDEDLTAREELLKQNLATIWVGKKRATAVLLRRAFRAQGKRNFRLPHWARARKAAEAEAAKKKAEEETERLAREEAARLEREEAEQREKQEEEDARLAAQLADEEAAKNKDKAPAASLPVAEADVEEVVEEMEGEEAAPEGSARPRVPLININEFEHADCAEIRSAMAAARKVPGSDRCPTLVRGPTDRPRFGAVKAWAKYLTLGRKPYSSECPFHPEALADPAFRQRCREMGIDKLVGLNEKGSLELAREIYTNILWRYDNDLAL